MIPPLHRPAVAKRSASSIRVGCAGWSIPREHADRFPEEGSHLARYAGRFPAVEINSSFYKPHRPATYARWAASVPADFRFSVKVPKLATHERRANDPQLRRPGLGRLELVEQLLHPVVILFQERYGRVRGQELEHERCHR